MIRKKIGHQQPPEDPPRAESAHKPARTVNPGSFLETSELKPLLSLLQALIPTVAMEKMHKHLPEIRSLLEQWPTLLSRTPELREAVNRLNNIISCEYCNAADAQLSLSCSHRLCLSCFYKLLEEVTQNYVVYTRFEKLQLPPLTCRLCHQQVSTKDMEKGLPHFAEFERAAEQREDKLLSVCRSCRNQNEASQHDCLCKKCFALALLSGCTQCEHCQQEFHPQDPMQAELAKNDDFTVTCVQCEMPVPFRYMLLKSCCTERLCAICQLTKGFTACANCQKQLEVVTKERLRVINQELQQVLLEEPSLIR